MPAEDVVSAARAENDKLREQIAAKQAENEVTVAAANDEYNLQALARERETLERELAVLNERPVVSIPQVVDDTQVFADTVQLDAQPEVAQVKSVPTPAPKVSTTVPSTPTDVATINPQGE